MECQKCISGPLQGCDGICILEVCGSCDMQTKLEGRIAGMEMHMRLEIRGRVGVHTKFEGHNRVEIAYECFMTTDREVCQHS